MIAPACLPACPTLPVYSPAFCSSRVKHMREAVNRLVQPTHAEKRAVEAVFSKSGDSEDAQMKVLAEWRLDVQSIVLDSVLAAGANGEVWAGNLLGQPVAVKRLLRHSVHKSSALKKFKAEIVACAMITHPCLVQFLGAAWDPPRVFLVMELCACGDLKTQLKRSTGPAVDERLRLHDALSWAQPLLRIATDVALALAYLEVRAHRASLLPSALPRFAQHHSLT